MSLLLIPFLLEWLRSSTGFLGCQCQQHGQQHDARRHQSPTAVESNPFLDLMDTMVAVGFSAGFYEMGPRDVSADQIEDLPEAQAIEACDYWASRPLHPALCTVLAELNDCVAENNIPVLSDLLIIAEHIRGFEAKQQCARFVPYYTPHCFAILAVLNEEAYLQYNAAPKIDLALAQCARLCGISLREFASMLTWFVQLPLGAETLAILTSYAYGFDGHLRPVLNAIPDFESDDNVALAVAFIPSLYTMWGAAKDKNDRKIVREAKARRKAAAAAAAAAESKRKEETNKVKILAQDSAAKDKQGKKSGILAWGSAWVSARISRRGKRRSRK